MTLTHRLQFYVGAADVFLLLRGLCSERWEGAYCFEVNGDLQAFLNCQH